MPWLLSILKSTWQVANYQSDQDKVYRVERNLRYLAKVAVNGHPETLGADVATQRYVAELLLDPHDRGRRYEDVSAEEGAGRGKNLALNRLELHSALTTL